MPHNDDLHLGYSRRRALTLGGSLAAGGLLATSGPLSAAASAHGHDGALPKRGELPADQIQTILQAEGAVSSGVLSIDVSRDDIGDVTGPDGVTFTPSFMVDGTLTFQPLGNGRAFFNGDLALKTEETNAFIDAILANGLTIQAFHQHYDISSPQIWFMHWRGTGDAIALATAVRKVLAATSIPLPQKSATNPNSPLDADRLGRILGGSAEIGSDGVITALVPRKGKVVIDGVHVSPEANISSNIAFRPLGGSRAAVAPDFGMSSSEVNAVLATMRPKGWHVGCLYNQETGETPQLYFAHMIKTGDAYTLAQEVRQGLERTDV